MADVLSVVMLARALANFVQFHFAHYMHQWRRIRLVCNIWFKIFCLFKIQYSYVFGTAWLSLT